jgi:hypothetical protein
VLRHIREAVGLELLHEHNKSKGRYATTQLSRGITLDLAKANSQALPTVEELTAAAAA